MNSTAAPSDDNGPEGAKADVAAKLVLKRAGLELFHDSGRRAFADLRVRGHRETHRLDSREFREWMELLFHSTTQMALGQRASRDAVEFLSARARFQEAECMVYRRIANLGDEIWIDLGSSDWSAIHITKDGWRVVKEPDVRFERTPSMQALATPVPGGTIRDLRPFLSWTDDRVLPHEDEMFLLCVAWLFSGLWGRKPYPILVVNGEQGSGKSTLAGLLHELVDPSSSDLRAPPKQERDLIAALEQSYVLSFDNLSSLKGDVADTFCRMSTGGSLTTRVLYTTADELAIDAARPIIVNGIPDLCSRPDLASRCIVLRLPRMTQRESLEALKERFQQAKPRIMGGLCDALVAAIRNRESRVLNGSSARMLDLANLLHAAEVDFGFPDHTFSAVLEAASQDLVERELELDMVAVVVRDVAQNTSHYGSQGLELSLNGGVIASASTWHPVLKREAERRAFDTRRWPSTPKALSDKLRRLAPSLSQVGVEVDCDAGTSSARRIHIYPTRQDE